MDSSVGLESSITKVSSYQLSVSMNEEFNTGVSEQDLVKECLIEIFRLNGYENVSRLTQRDYEHISHEIETKTTTLISVSTLKRLLNGAFSRIPQTATLNAISNYLGYKSWQEYKLSFKAKRSYDTVLENNGADVKADIGKRKV